MSISLSNRSVTCTGLCFQQNGSPSCYSEFDSWLEANYSNKRVFLLMDYRLIDTPRKFDDLKTNINPRSEALTSYILVLKEMLTKKEGEQGWHSGESTRLPPMWSWRHMWVEFVIGSRPCYEGFSPGTPVFLPPQKSTFPNSNSTWKLRATPWIPLKFLFINLF